MLFGFRGQEAVDTAFGYTKLVFDVSILSYILVLMRFSSSSSSSPATASTNEYTVALGAAR